MQLIALGAIWGGAHALTRYCVPTYGPVVLIELRIASAAMLLAFVAWWTRRPLSRSSPWRPIVVLGTINTAIPFLLLTYAAKTLNASVLSVLNATAPVFAAIIGALWLREALAVRTIIGLIVGIAGVAVLVSNELVNTRIDNGIAILAALGTSCAYGFSSNYARRHAADLDHFKSAHGSLWVALILVTPAAPFFPPPGPVTPGSVVAVLTLGLVCTGVAYLIYFRLIRDVGPISALTVAYLIPVFGVLWGALFLGEPVTLALLLGGSLVVVGTALTTGVGVGKMRRLLSR
jgi:drug/metabolite transporter (DMT)-like permease